MVSMYHLSKLQIVASKSPVGTNRNFYYAAGVPDGIPKNGIVQIEGSHCIEWFIEFLRASPKITFFWSELDQSALALRRLIQSQKYDVILARNAFTDTRIISTLQIFAKQAGVLLFLIGGTKHNSATSDHLHLQITSAW